jgi:hypothetical protein
MQDLLVASLLPALQDLPFISRWGGLAKTLKTTSTSGAEVRQPLTEDNKPLTPDSKEKGVLYFEHGRLDVVDTVGTNAHLSSLLRLVFWGNLGNAGGAYNGAFSPAFSTSRALGPALAQAAIMKRIPMSTHLARPAFAVLHTFGRILLPQDGLFDKYTFDEKATQYLMAPYTAFGIEIKTSFKIPLSCVSQS